MAPCIKGGDLISRKRKPSRKYTPRNEFRINNSPHARSHPHYVFGQKGNKFKSLGLTSHPKKDIPHTKLTQNPEPNNPDDSYLQLTKPHTADIKYYSQPLPGWQFHQDDLPKVRHRIKQYKKSMNRKPPMWYEKKKQKKK